MNLPSAECEAAPPPVLPPSNQKRTLTAALAPMLSLFPLLISWFHIEKYGFIDLGLPNAHVKEGPMAMLKCSESLNPKNEIKESNCVSLSTHGEYP